MPTRLHLHVAVPAMLAARLCQRVPKHSSHTKSQQANLIEPALLSLDTPVRISAPIIKRGCSLAPSSAHDQPHSSHHDLAPVSTGKATAATPTRSGAGNTHATANGTAGAQVPPAAQATCLVGWEDVELEYLLAEFHYLEQVGVG